MLRWRKRQNEAKIRSKLLQTKQMKEQDQLAQLVTNKAQIKAEWIQRVVEDEINKPLQVTDEFIEEMVELERQNRARQQKARDLYASTIAKEKARIQKTVDLRARSIHWTVKNEEWKKQSRFITKAGTEALLSGGFDEGELDSLEVLTASLRQRRQHEGEGTDEVDGEEDTGGKKTKKGKRKTKKTTKKKEGAEEEKKKEKKGSTGGAKGRSEDDAEADEHATAGVVDMERQQRMAGSASMPALSDPRLDALLEVERRIKMQRAQGGLSAAATGGGVGATLSTSSSASMASAFRGDGDRAGFKTSIAVASKQHPGFAQSLQELSTSSSLFSLSGKPGQKHPIEKLKTRNKTISVRF